MFFFFPYNSDSPIYHYPLATAAMILINVGVFVAMFVGGDIDFESWMLTFGDGLHPQQWLTSMFTHAGPGHLVANMMFLWVFGLVVEGKLGWWKFLGCYLGIGVVQAMLEQIVMLGYSGEVPGSVGASSAIYGIMALAAVWAPMNQISFVWIVMLYIIRTGTFEVSILMIAIGYFGLDLTLALLFGGGAASSLLHLSGVALGLPLGIVLLKSGVVDCESWDVFHVLKGDYGAFNKEAEPKQVFAKMDRRQKQRDESHAAAAKKQLHEYLKAGNAAAAVVLYQ